MSHPTPKICPFCACPTSIDLSDDELVPMLTVSEEFLDMIDDINNNNDTESAPTSANAASASFSIGSSDDQGTRGSIKKRSNKKKKGKGKGGRGKKK